MICQVAVKHEVKLFSKTPEIFITERMFWYVCMLWSKTKGLVQNKEMHEKEIKTGTKIITSIKY